MPGSSKPPDDLEAVRTVVDALQGFEADDQRRILRWAQEKLGLVTTAGRVAVASAEELQPSILGTRDIRSFLDEKRPASDIHFAAAVAYFYAFEAPVSERKQDISASDLQEAARMAGRERLTRPIVTLHNAVKSGYLNKGPDRGSFRINTVGENLVAMAMPASEATATKAGRAPGAAKKKPTRKRKASRRV